MSDPRDERIARNEVLFREINERLKEMEEGFDVASDTLEFVCECGNVECTRRITLTLAEYERVRGDPVTFGVVPGHQAEDVEDVVEEFPAYLIVKKRGRDAVRIARGADPRS